MSTQLKKVLRYRVMQANILQWTSYKGLKMTKAL